MQDKTSFKRQINNRKEAHITRIEFASVEEDHIIVRFTCQTSRPTTTAVSTHLVKDGTPARKHEVRGIQNALSSLRDEYPGTKIVLDPDAELQPLSPLAKWNYSWEDPLYRASLGLAQNKSFELSSDDLDHVSTLDEEDMQWVLDHGQHVLKTKSNGKTSTATGAQA